MPIQTLSSGINLEPNEKAAEFGQTALVFWFVILKCSGVVVYVLTAKIKIAY